MTSKPFSADVKILREPARQHIEHGAVTAGDGAEEQQHAVLLAQRIVHVDGEPIFFPKVWLRMRMI